jgi:nitrate reductase gamma subunit
MSFGEVSLGLFGLFLLINPFGRVEHPIYETLESVIVSGLVLSLRVENTDAIQEALKFTWSEPVLLVASRLLHHIDRMIHFSLLVVALGWARLVHVAQVLLMLSSVEGHLLD